MRLSILFCLYVLSFPATAQFGISGAYLAGQAENWETPIIQGNDPAIALPGNGWQAGVDYWFRLKNVRVEFLPTLAISQQNYTLTSLAAEAQTTGFHFFFNTNLYLFDFKGDCDCPTWSKEGPTLEKGLYLQLSPGISYFDFNLDEVNELASTESLAPSIGVGIGFDLGLSDLLTISPQIGARYYPSVEWEGLTQTGATDLTGVQDESSLWSYTAGLRIGIRLDQ